MSRFSILALIALCVSDSPTNAVSLELVSVGWDDPPGFVFDGNWSTGSAGGSATSIVCKARGGGNDDTYQGTSSASGSSGSGTLGTVTGLPTGMYTYTCWFRLNYTDSQSVAQFADSATMEAQSY